MKRADWLKAATEIRTKVLPLEGMDLTIAEPSRAAFAAYGETLKSDSAKAIADLLVACVSIEGEPLTAEEAMQIAAPARLATPIVAVIMELSGFGATPEKQPDAS